MSEYITCDVQASVEKTSNCALSVYVLRKCVYTV